jgi:hypothetical protein
MVAHCGKSVAKEGWIGRRQNGSETCSHKSFISCLDPIRLPETSSTTCPLGPDNLGRRDARVRWPGWLAWRLPQKAKREAARAQRGSEIVVGCWLELSPGLDFCRRLAKAHQKFCCRAVRAHPTTKWRPVPPRPSAFLLLSTSDLLSVYLRPPFFLPCAWDKPVSDFWSFALNIAGIKLQFRTFSGYLLFCSVAVLFTHAEDPIS